MHPLVMNPDSLFTGGNKPVKPAWRLLHLLNYYRMAVSTLLLFLYFTDLLFKPLGSHNLQLFVYASSTYLLIAVIFQSMLLRHQPALNAQIHLSFSVDTLFVLLVIHASGGINSGLGSLLVVSIIVASTLLKGRSRFLPAALASIAVLLLQFVSGLENSKNQGALLQAGILGITFFATSLLVVILTRRIQESEALAEQTSIDLANMAQLTEHVIQRMQTGVIVVDEDLTLRLINTSAWQMLGTPASQKINRLSQLSDELLARLVEWKRDPFAQTAQLKPISAHTDIRPRFAQLGQDKKHGVLIFLEDISALAQQAQQMQLAALGQLTASIAHEIRNPLGAISHAGQLLAESDNINEHDQRLTQIISDNTSRLNNIVSTVMQISRRDPHHIERFRLKDFLEKFIPDYQIGETIEPGSIQVSIEPADVEVRFDTSQLRQILVNLCDNALRHCADYPGQPKIELRGGISSDFERPFLDIIDHGPGIPADDIPHIFEPFFTSSTNGTGLGLYISRQLAESNQAYLNYLIVPTGGACFRISFQDPRRNIN